jgi:hypothetical protein
MHLAFKSAKFSHLSIAATIPFCKALRALACNNTARTKCKGVSKLHTDKPTDTHSQAAQRYLPVISFATRFRLPAAGVYNLTCQRESGSIVGAGEFKMLPGVSLP